MSVDDHGLEVLRKSGIDLAGGKREYAVRTMGVPFADSVQSKIFSDLVGSITYDRVVHVYQYPILYYYFYFGQTVQKIITLEFTNDFGWIISGESEQYLLNEDSFFTLTEDEFQIILENLFSLQNPPIVSLEDGFYLLTELGDFLVIQ